MSKSIYDELETKFKIGDTVKYKEFGEVKITDMFIGNTTEIRTHDYHVERKDGIFISFPNPDFDEKGVLIKSSAE